MTRSSTNDQLRFIRQDLENHNYSSRLHFPDGGYKNQRGGRKFLGMKEGDEENRLYKDPK